MSRRPRTGLYGGAPTREFERVEEIQGLRVGDWFSFRHSKEVFRVTDLRPGEIHAWGGSKDPNGVRSQRTFRADVPGIRRIKTPPADKRGEE